MIFVLEMAMLLHHFGPEISAVKKPAVFFISIIFACKKKMLMLTKPGGTLCNCLESEKSAMG